MSDEDVMKDIQAAIGKHLPQATYEELTRRLTKLPKAEAGLEAASKRIEQLERIYQDAHQERLRLEAVVRKVDEREKTLVERERACDRREMQNAVNDQIVAGANLRVADMKETIALVFRSDMRQYMVNLSGGASFQEPSGMWRYPDVKLTGEAKGTGA